MIPKLTRSASLGHGGAHRPVASCAGAMSTTSLLWRHLSLPVTATVRPPCLGGEGHWVPHRRARGHLLAGPMALPPTGMAADPGCVEVARAGRASHARRWS